MASLHNAVEEDSAKALVNEATKPRKTPLSVTLYRGINFPDDGVTFRAAASYRGKPWFDFGWIRTGKTQGSEPDNFDTNPRENHRQLVKFWAFAEVEGKAYALVDVFRKVRRGSGRNRAEDFWDHPVLKVYEHVYYKKGDQVKEPFFAVPVSSIIGAACVFPCVDQGRKPDDYRPGLRVLYHPPLVEFCGFKTHQLPLPSLFPEPSIDELAHCEGEELGEAEDSEEEAEESEADD